MEAEPTDTVKTFKAAYAALTGLQADLLTVCYNGQERTDAMTLADEPFTPSGTTEHTFIHIRVEDEELNAAVEKRLAEGNIIIPFDQIKVRD